MCDNEELLPNLTARKDGVWATSTVFDERLVNPLVTLPALGLQYFRGIYPLSLSVGNVMKDIYRFCKIKSSSKPLSATNTSFRYFMNGIWISDGSGSSQRHATLAAINNALIYLIQRKGLKIISCESVPEHATVRVQGELLTQGTNNDIPLIRVNIAKQLETFLANPRLMRLEVVLGGMSQVVQNEIHNTANKCRLRHKNEDGPYGKVAVLWKINSILHNLNENVTNQSRINAKVPQIESMVSRKDKKKNTQEIQSWTQVNVKSLPSSQQPPRQKKDRKALKAEKRLRRSNRKQQNKQLGVVPKVKSKQARQNKLRGAGNHGNNGCWEFDPASLNPTLLKNKGKKSSFKFPLLVRGWLKDPVYLLKMSALCGGMSCRFVADSSVAAGNHGNMSGGESVSVRLFVDEQYIAVGTGSTFEAAQLSCATTTVNFIRSRNVKLITNKTWNRFIRLYEGCHDDEGDVMRRVSKDNLGKAGVLSTAKITHDNVGFKLLAAMGWKSGCGLGKRAQGRTEPVDIGTSHNSNHHGNHGNRHTGFGYQEAASSEITIDKAALEGEVIMFKNNPKLWKLEFVDGLNESEQQLLSSVCGRHKLQLCVLKSEELGTKVMIWKKKNQAMGSAAEKGINGGMSDYEMSDDEDRDGDDGDGEGGEGGEGDCEGGEGDCEGGEGDDSAVDDADDDAEGDDYYRDDSDQEFEAVYDEGFYYGSRVDESTAQPGLSTTGHPSPPPHHSTPQLSHTHSSTPQFSDAHSYSRNQDAHSYSRNQDAHPYSRNQDAHSYSRNQDAHSYSRNQDAHSYSRNQDAHSYSINQDAHPYSRNQDAHSYSRNQDAHPYSRNQDAHPNSRNQDAHPYSRNQDAHPYSRNQDAHPNSRHQDEKTRFENSSSGYSNSNYAKLRGPFQERF